MRYLALATDYDGTLASEGCVSATAVRALERLVASGRKLVLVTGRRLDDMRAAFDRFDLFDRIVGENGAILCDPRSGRERVLGAAPPAGLMAALRDRGVEPLSVGRVVVATSEAHRAIVLETIGALGLRWHIETNKGSAMALPEGVDKGAGLQAALEELGIACDRAVGVGDAENDAPFLSRCGCAVAVAGAVASVARGCDWVTAARDGAGVVELIDRLLADDLRGLGRRAAVRGTPA